MQIYLGESFFCIFVDLDGRYAMSKCRSHVFTATYSRQTYIAEAIGARANYIHRLH